MIFKGVGILLVYSIVFGCVIETRAIADDNGAHLYQKVIDRYKALKSYADEGITTFSIGNDLSIKQEVRFKTYFRDPNLIRFEFTRHPTPEMKFVTYKTVFWHDGEKTFLLHDNAAVEEVSLTTAFAKASGVSAFTASKIPSLLLDEGLGSGIHRLVEPLLAGEEEVDGSVCYRLQLKRRNGIQITLWISKGDMLIQRIAEEGYLTEYRNITIDLPIPNKVFDKEYGESAK